MTDTSIQTDDAPISQQVSPAQSVSENEWLEQRRSKRKEERAQERQVEAKDEPAQEAEPDPVEAEPAAVEAEAEEPTREDADLLTEGEAAEAETPDAEETDDYFPETVPELAESLGFEPDQLSEHLKITVRPNGQEQTVSLAELSKGYERHEDYKAKTRALADDKRSFEATSQQSLERQKASVEQLDAVAMVLAREIDMGPDDAEIARISREEPHRYPQVVEDRNRKLQAYQQAQAARQQVAQQAEERTRSEVTRYRGEQQKKLAERLPDMKVPDKAKAMEDTMRSFLTGPDVGFTDEEVTAFINGPFDHRQVLVIARAAQGAAQKAVEKKVQKKLKKLPKVGRSGARRAQAQKGSSDLRSARKRLKTDQSVDSGLALLKARRLARRNAANGGSQ